MQDWLVLVYRKLRGVEYGLLLTTFGAIMVLGLELGIAVGIAAASVLFAYNYSKVVPCASDKHCTHLTSIQCIAVSAAAARLHNCYKHHFCGQGLC